jgi:hypothetical protein
VTGLPSAVQKTGGDPRVYLGLENIQASEIFGKIVMEHLGDSLEAAE